MPLIFLVPHIRANASEDVKIDYSRSISGLFRAVFTSGILARYFQIFGSIGRSYYACSLAGNTGHKAQMTIKRHTISAMPLHTASYIQRFLSD